MPPRGEALLTEAVANVTEGYLEVLTGEEEPPPDATLHCGRFRIGDITSH
jgi:hypothetical protein